MNTDIYREITERFRKEGRMRRIPAHRSGSGMTDLCSNDYMGLAARAHEWTEEFRKRFPSASMTSSASRLLASDQEIYLLLEGYLEKCYGRPALLFNSGYHANTGLVSALDVPGTLWATDKLVHASVIDGLRMSGADFKRWNHNDTVHLRRILEKEHDSRERIIVVCESVYSMDGDIAPLRDLSALKHDFPKMMLYVDEAHAIGAIGPRGLGVAVETRTDLKADIIVGTLGKACASEGAFVICSGILKDYLINSARSLIFSTAIAPANAAWSLFMLKKLADMECERRYLEEISETFRKGIERITGRSNPSRSSIVPLVTGDAETATKLSLALEKAGILALPIRRPTVPPGGERIRFSLNAILSVGKIHEILEIIEEAYDNLR